MIVLAKEEKRALLLLCGCFLLGVALYYFKEGELATGREMSQKGPVTVTITGAVEKKGKKEVPYGTPIEQVIKEANPTAESDLSKVSLGKRVTQESTLHVPEAASKKINLNTATFAQLENLPGIGSKTAEKIIELRKTKRKFYHIEELMEVKGIGQKKFQQLSSYIETK